MAYTYSKIATYTVGSGGIPSVSFLNIPQNYTDLVVKVSARTDRATGSASDFSFIFNNSTTGYTDRYVYGNGSSTGSGSNAYTNQGFAGNITQATMTASTFGSVDIYIPNYASANYKSISTDATTENNATLTYNMPVATLWSNTSPITSITLQSASGGNLVQYSTFHLYGIKAEL